MVVLVCYDVGNTVGGGARRLRKAALACKDYGVRVQRSIFECSIEQKDWVVLRSRLLQICDASEDSFRFYFICENDRARTEHHGVRRPIDLNSTLLV